MKSLWLGAAGAVVLTLSLHCGNSGGSSGFGEQDGGGSSSGTSGLSSSGFGGDASDDRNRVCSGDLQSVLRDDGTLVEKCAPDQGCSAGKCIAACDAAGAAKGSLGCDYVIATPAFHRSLLDPCFAVFVANAWGKDAKLTVSRAGVTYDVTQFGRIPQPGAAEASWPTVPATGLPAGQVAVLFLSSDPAANHPIGGSMKCPVAPALPQSTALRTSGTGKAWHIVSDVPLTAYDILPYGGAKSYLPSAGLIFPTTAWGKNYYGIVPRLGEGGGAGPQWGLIVAKDDGTKVDIVPNVALPGGGGVAPAPKNVLTSYTLNAGDFIQFHDTGDMSASVIAADKPVAFSGGNGYICYTGSSNTGGGCDSAHQQVPPIAAMANEYAISPYATRRNDGQAESIKYRIVGAVDGTTLTYEPATPGAPATLNAGQVVDFERNTAFIVKSQDDKHPFFLAQTMSGCQVTSGTKGDGCLGDDEYVNLVPPAQFLQKYIFFTDPSYKFTTVAVVRKKTAAGFKDVTIGCLGPLTGWKPIGASTEYEFTTAELVWAGAGKGTCKNGGQVASSDGAFGVMVWGMDSYASYGYPAGGNIAPINAVVVPPTPK